MTRGSHRWGTIDRVAGRASPRAAGAPLDASSLGGGSEESGEDDQRASEDAIGEAVALPIAVYVSSTSGDRRAAKNCRFAVDFLLNKKVPHTIIDLAVKPHLRSQLAERLGVATTRHDTSAAAAAAAAPAPSAADDASVDADESTRPGGTSIVPAVDVGGEAMLTLAEMQDLEDHGELDPLVEAVLRTFADRDLAV